MNRQWDNPVAQHAGRLIGRSGRPWAVVLLFAATALLGLALVRFWTERDLYSLVTGPAFSRWLALTLIGEYTVALPWAAARGALVWRRLEREGHLDEYRRSRTGALSIAAGMVWAALQPAALLIGISLAGSLAVSLRGEALPAGGVLLAHGLLLVEAAAFAAAGIWLAGRLRFPGLAVPAALLGLAAATLAIRGIDPFLRTLPAPETWIYAALLPNPATAVASVLETDLLRVSWIYERLRAPEYFYVYPPVWQTAGLYLAALGAAFGLTVRRIARPGD